MKARERVAISVIVRTLGGSTTLGDAFASLRQQTRRDFEVVLVDISDGGADRAIEVHCAGLPMLRRVVPRGFAAHYSRLRAQIEPVISALPSTHFGVEHFVRSRGTVPPPGPGEVIRYEWRGQRLLEEGRVPHVITQRDHLQPLLAALGG